MACQFESGRGHQSQQLQCDAATVCGLKRVTGDHMTKTELKTETIEEYLARGGKVQKIPYGVRAIDQTEGYTPKWGKKNGKRAAPKAAARKKK